MTTKLSDESSTSFNQFRSLLKKKPIVILTTHVLPDGDGLGAQAALYHFLNSLGCKTVVFNQDPIPPRYRFLDKERVFLSHTDSLIPFFSNSESANAQKVWLIVDTFLPSRVGQIWDKLRPQVDHVFFLDHHVIPNKPAYKPNEYLISEPTRSSIGELTYELLEHLTPDVNASLTPKIYEALYVSVMTDTNSFRYARTTSLAHKIASEAIQSGLNPEKIYQEIYSSKTLNHIKLLGQLLTKTKTAFDERVAWIEIQEQDRELFSASEDDTLSFPNSLLLLEKAEVVCSFREAEHGAVRVSFRSKGRIPVIDVALALKGGGHEFSSGAKVPGTLREVVEKTLPLLEKVLSGAPLMN